jgi:hypothetical protein
MNKFIMLAISTLSTINSMNYVNNEPQDTFTNLTVLNYDGNTHNACYIAQTAKIVHSNIAEDNLSEITTIQKKYAHIKNLIFTTPQPNLYDAVTIYNPNILSKKRMIDQLCDMYKYLKLNGDLHALIQTQTHYPSIHETAFLTIYPQIYESLSSDMQKQIKPKYHPSVITLKSKFLTDKEAKDYIWTSGYDIISSQEVSYEIAKPITEIKHMLKCSFFKEIEPCEFSQETSKSLWKKYISLILNQYKKNNETEMLVPFNATKLHLRNTTGSMRLKLNWHPCFGPKELYTNK